RFCLRKSVNPPRREFIILSKGSAAVGATTINKHRTHEYEPLDPRLCGGASKLQRTFRIYGAVEVDRTFLVHMMYTGRQMNDGLRTTNRVRPVGRRTNGPYGDFIDL